MEHVGKMFASIRVALLRSERQKAHNDRVERDCLGEGRGWRHQGDVSRSTGRQMPLPTRRLDRTTPLRVPRPPLPPVRIVKPSLQPVQPKGQQRRKKWLWMTATRWHYSWEQKSGSTAQINQRISNISFNYMPREVKNPAAFSTVTAEGKKKKKYHSGAQCGGSTWRHVKRTGAP